MERIVFHLINLDLFEPFLRGLPRQAPLDVLRKNERLRNKYFRGHRFTRDHPDFSSLCSAFHTEINENADEDIINFFCFKWVLGHSDLAKKSLAALGIDGVDPGTPSTWLTPTHEVLEDRGHIEAARSIVRAVGITYRLDDILIFVSLLSVHCEDQRGLRVVVEQEFEIVQDNPHLLIEHLEREKGTLREQLLALDRKHTETLASARKQQSELAGQLETSDGESRLIAEDIERSSSRLEAIEAEITKTQARKDSEKQKLERLEKRKQKATNLGSHLRAELASVETKKEEVVASHDRRKRSIESDLEQIRRRSAEVHERLKEPEPVPIKTTINRSLADGPAEKASTDRSQPGGWVPTLEDLTAIVSQPGFTCTPVTLEIARRHTTHSLDGIQLRDEPPIFPIERPEAAGSYWAQRAVSNEPRWNCEHLIRYAIARTFCHDGRAFEARADLLIAGLYHSTKVDNPEMVDLLLRLLVEIGTGEPHSTARTVEQDDKVFHTIEERGSDQETLQLLGSIQAKLAGANPRALRRLYELLEPRARVVAKRALASHVHQLRVQETDATHELLDVVTDHIGSLLGPLTATFRAWWSRARLHEQVQNDRKLLLATTAKLLHLFSMAADANLTRFRDLLGPRLSEALRENTPESYSRLSLAALGFCVHECEEPEWVSSRFLFPFAFQMGRSASQEDLQARRQLKAVLSVTLEKQQHPIGGVRSKIPVGTLIMNRGTATATDLEVLLVTPSRSAATVQNPEASIQSCRVGEAVRHQALLDITTPLPVLELECLITWRDPSSSEVNSLVDKLKIIAQREVDWDQARINPYILRSISDPERLVGRQDALAALRRGVLGVQSFCLMGQKRVGKTSVARVLLREFQAREDYLAVYLPLGELTTNTAPTLILSLCQAIVEELPDAPAEELLRTLPSQEEFAVNPKHHSRRFLKALDTQLSGKKVLCIIDDLDELDEALYKGSEAADLFLYLRALIDRGNFAFILVGSEKMPEILRHQGARLNQVKPYSLDYILDDSALRTLAATPAAPHLEFGNEAIQQITFYSSGNPYYATQICNRVYDDMVSRKDHFVASADVRRSVEAICAEGIVTMFQHFWTDGIFDGGSDQKQMEYLNARILITCADLGGRDCRPIQRSVLLDEITLRSYDPAEARYRLDNLVDRGVLLLAQDSVRIRVPLLATWLQGRGSAAVRASFGKEDFEARLATPATGVSPRRILDVSEDLVYQDAPVSDLQVKAWLDQFTGQRHQELAMALLQHLKSDGYIDDAKLHQMCKSLHKIIVQEETSSSDWAPVVKRRKITNLFVSYLGKDGKSGSTLLYRYRTANNLPAEMTGSPQDAVEFLKGSAHRQKKAVVVMIDDFIGTGGSCIEGLAKFHELTTDIPGTDQNVSFYVGVLVGFQAGLEAVRSTESDVRVLFQRELDSSNRAFSPDAGIFKSEADRVEAERMCRGIGEVLEPRQPLGFGDCQALITFQHRCPNNTLPIFYKAGARYHGREWRPLFRR